MPTSHNTRGGATRNITFPYDSECRTNNVFSGVVVGQYRKITAPIFFGLGVVIFLFLAYAVIHYMAGATAQQMAPPENTENEKQSAVDVVSKIVKPVQPENAGTLKSYLASSIGMVVFASVMASVYLILLASIIHSKLTFEHIGGED